MLKFSFILFIIVFSSVSQARQSCDWPFKTSVVINEKSNNNLTDYTVSLALSGGLAGNLHADYQWSSDGQDLRFYDSDDNTELDFNIDSWDATHKAASVRVLLPTLNSQQAKSIYVYYGNESALSQSSGNLPDITYVNGKIKFHTRFNTTDTTSLNHAKLLFDGADDSNSQYGCSHPNIFSEITNVNQGDNRSKKNFIAYSQTLFTVNPGEGGEWGIRYGADYGWGGGLYVNGVALDERWDRGLWWARSWSSKDVLAGRITLAPGEHKLEIIGAEDGNDGGLTIQLKKPGGNWVSFNNHNINMRSQSCPIVFHTVQYGSHDVCNVDLALNASENIASSWIINSSNDIKLQVRYVGSTPTSAHANPPTHIDISLPNEVSLDGYSGSNWSCSGVSGVINCSYSHTLNTNNPLSSELILNTRVGGSAGSNINISAQVYANTLDNNLSNNHLTQNIALLTNTGLAADCSQPQPGIWARYYDISNYNPVKISDAASYQAMINSRMTPQYLYGQTIASSIDGSGNPFSENANPNHFVLVFQGYLYMPTEETYSFGVDGDDAVEAWVDKEVVSAYYGLHAPKKSPQDVSGEIKLSAGFTPIEFRMQEHTGGDQHTFYWRKKGNNGSTVIPSSAYYHCAGNPNIQLNTHVQVIRDDVNGNNNPKAIPNAIIHVSVNAINQGNISTDLGTTEITQAIDSGTELYVGDFQGSGPINYVDGTNSSGLNFQYITLNDNTDSIRFSSDGIHFDHTATPNGDGYDPSITRIKINFGGSFKPQMNSIQPSFSFNYQTRIK